MKSKTMLLGFLAVVVALSGCVYYPDDYYTPTGYYVQRPVPPPAYVVPAPPPVVVRPVIPFSFGFDFYHGHGGHYGHGGGHHGGHRGHH